MREVPTIEERLLILAPRGRDAGVIAEVMRRDDVKSEVAQNLEGLHAAIKEGAAAAVISEEALIGQDLSSWHLWLASQAPWSDFPFVILLSQKLDRKVPAFESVFNSLGNVILLERPLSAETLSSAILSALRARQRQYHTRAVLLAKERVSEELVALNATLELRVDARTRALAQANDRLTAEVMEKEKAQSAMLQYQKMESLGRLTGGVAHDFNNILSIIQSSMELLLLVSSDDTVRRRAQTVKSACERGAKLTSQLLTFARNQTLDIKPLMLRPLFENVASLAKPLLGPHIELIIEVFHEAEYALADPSQIEMALLNLVINSRDALQDSGRITLSSSRMRTPAGLSQEHEYVRIAVVDDGSGMSPEVVAKAFDPFFTTKGVGKGTGLGLSQVYGMAEQSGGMARIHSNRETGTTVEIWLRAVTLKEELLEEEHNFVPLAGKKVLVVEDDPAVRANMVDALLALGMEVSQAADGSEGLSQLAQQRPDVLITDYLMPDMTGAELARSAFEKFPGLPLIVATGYADMEAVQRAVGKATVLRKPFKMADLHSAIGKVLQDAGS